ncbi:hypothetical protein ABEH28_11885 [Pseudomonas sp. Ps21-P2]|uniref:hypothetical protein n=1 Tax=Pseudomonas sp. Ps21-P2 TaxID=3080331 RepID=UPI0032089BD8
MIDRDQIRKLSPADGDIFTLPADTPFELAQQLGEAITIAMPGIKAVVICADLRQADESVMNAAGWYRK